MASFRNGFSGVTQHGDLLLEWDRADATDYPLVIHARVMNKTSDYEVNMIETDITVGLTDDSFLWEDLPSPLPFFSNATYELQVLPQQQAGGVISEPVIASSPSFTIKPPDENDSDSGQTTTYGTEGPVPRPTGLPHADGRPNENTAIAAGLVVPLVVGVAVFVFLRMYRRQRRIREERRKERAGLVID
ncbi:hypothetical protein F4802DRAFT_128980 [Xylaria palmicola]|nr:hypothetical protein F4802DRAFT_128980 [Xylaria palmicola]